MIIFYTIIFSAWLALSLSLKESLLKIKPYVNLLFVFILSITVFTLDNSKINFDIQLLQFEINEIVIMSYVITFALMSFLRNGREKYSYKFIIFCLVSILVASFTNLGNISIFLPLLIVFYNSKKNGSLNISSKYLILTSWTSFLLLENFNYEGIFDVVFILISTTFCFYLNKLFKEKRKIVFESFPVLLLHISSIPFAYKVNKYILLSLVCIYLYLFILKIFSDKSSKYLIFLSPAMFYLSIVSWGNSFNHVIYIPYLVFLTVALKSYSRLNASGKTLVGSLFLLMFSACYYFPNMVLIEGLNNSGHIVAYHIVQLIINFIVGYFLGENIRSFISQKDIFKEEIKKNDLINNSFILLTGIISFYIIFSIQTVVIVDLKTFQDKLLTYIFTFMSLIIGIMLRYIADNSLYLSRTLDRIYFLLKRIYVLREVSQSENTTRGDSLKSLDLKEVSYLFSNIEEEKKYKLTIIISLVFIILIYLMAVA